jgi:hypothetical protein
MDIEKGTARELLPAVYKSPPPETEPTQQEPSPQKNEDFARRKRCQEPLFELTALN